MATIFLFFIFERFNLSVNGKMSIKKAIKKESGELKVML